MPYFAIGSAIYLAVIFSFIYRINDQKLIGCVSIIISRFTFLLPLRCTSNRRHWTCTRLDLQQAAHLRCTPWVLSSWYSLLTLIPSYTPWIAWNTRLQLNVNWYILQGLASYCRDNSCNVILLLCITCSKSIDTVQFLRFLRLTGTSLFIHHQTVLVATGHRYIPFLPSYCIRFWYWVRIPMQHFILPFD